MVLSYLPTKTCFPNGGERVSCRGQKLTNSLEKTTTGTFDLHVIRLCPVETAANFRASRLQANRRFLGRVFFLMFELEGLTKHLMTVPAGNSIRLMYGPEGNS